MVDLDLLEGLLLRAARQRRPVTYGELLAFFERRVTRITVSALCRDLGIVCRRLAAKGAPDLACLVVRKSDGLPGEGWFAGERQDAGYGGPSNGVEGRQWLRMRQEQAFDHFVTPGDAATLSALQG